MEVLDKVAAAIFFAIDGKNSQKFQMCTFYTKYFYLLSTY